MKSLLNVALLIPSLALASTWKNDPTHSKAMFSAKHMMISTVTGELGPITSTLELDDKDITRSKIDATIDIAGIDTGVDQRDTHLKSADFFDVQKFPTLTFKSKKIEKGTEGKAKVTGDLTIKGKSKEVTLDVEYTAEVANPFTKAMTRGFVANTTINREDFGLSWNAPLANNGVMVSKEIKITIEAEYVKEEGKNTAAAPAPAKK